MFALDYLEISFTETVKSTAPAFTVIISRMLLGKFIAYTKFFSTVEIFNGLTTFEYDHFLYNEYEL